MKLFGLSLNKQYVGKAKAYASRYRVALTSVAVLVVFSIAILRVGALTNPDMNQELYDQQLETISQVKFDEEAIEQIKALRDVDVNVDSNFNDDRNNPFSE